ncbi:hypothetical protein PBI_CHE8_93 [Mycobacterium phage Che8]|uniref:Uncharacterized protein n=1 Tax=Mycobacterium virus Che8 TaxID=205868 RepID=Q855B7_9CAUD|nr:hypothetical protein PBI_CHE8_93 [Mycobacterium phage Che8]AAN12491.1 hypothetical protein PBI_CHE8_93 [Mycobacterium phage Che8]
MRKTPEQQLTELRAAVFAIANALGAALPHTPEVISALNTLVDTEGEDK